MRLDGIGALAIMGLAVLAAAARAEDVPPSPSVDGMALAKLLPEPVLKRAIRSPAEFISDAAATITDFGSASALESDGIGRMVDLQRSKVRAREMARLLAADLNDDGSVSKAEADGVAAALSTGARAKLGQAWAQADADANGTVDAGEVHTYAQNAAVLAVSDVEAEGLRALMSFDLNGDGKVAIEEVIGAVAALQAVDLSALHKAF